jgi:hypothetical protein
MAEMMKADKSIRIRVTGWCDEIGGEEASNEMLQAKPKQEAPRQ